jgi:hypothetical protein
MVTNLEECLTQFELQGGEGPLTELKTLKKLARTVLEDRLDLRRATEEN